MKLNTKKYLMISALIRTIDDRFEVGKYTDLDIPSKTHKDFPPNYCDPLTGGRIGKPSLDEFNEMYRTVKELLDIRD